MRFVPTGLEGVWLIEPQRLEDPRGFFARTFCARTFGERGLNTSWVQHSVSYNEKAGTLRGLHLQVAPYEETKLVRCIQGAIYDVVLDLRPDSPSRGRWIARELTAENQDALYIPGGCAHGFQTVLPQSVVDYRISSEYVRHAARCVRWDDPAFGVCWPPGPRILSDRDRDAADYEARGN